MLPNGIRRKNCAEVSKKGSRGSSSMCSFLRARSLSLLSVYICTRVTSVFRFSLVGWWEGGRTLKKKGGGRGVVSGESQRDGWGNNGNSWWAMGKP